MKNINFQDILVAGIAAIAFGIGVYLPIALVFEAPVIAAVVGIIAGIGFFAFLHYQARKQDREEGKSARENTRRYQRRFSIAIGGYVVVLLLSVYFLDRIEQQPIRIILSILPMIPVLYGIWGYMEMIRNLDELQKRIQLEAIAFSMAMTGVITFTLGFLENVGVPQLNMIWVFPMMIAFWGVGQVIAQRRYG